MSLTLDGTTGISATGNIYGNNVIVSNSLTAGSFAPSSLSTAGNVTGGNILTTGAVSATGNVTGNYLLGNAALVTGLSASSISSGTSNVNVVSSGGNVTVGVGGTSNVSVFATTGQFVTGVMSSTGNGIHGNVLTGGLISATSTITSAANVIGGNITTGGLMSATGNLIGGNITTAGLITATGNVTANFFIGNGSQLTGLSGFSISNGTSNVVVASSANVTVAVTGNNIGTFAATGLLVNGVVSGSGNVTGGNVLTAGIMSSTGNGIHGNILTGGLISATSSITSAANVIGGNITTAGLITATGNVTGGNLLTGGLISATSTITAAANITGGNLLTAGLISATSTITSAANVTGGNITTAGLITATGNVIGGNIRTAGLITATGAITTAGDLTLTGNIVDTAALGINTTANANITLNAGTGFIIASSGILNGQANGTGNIGNSTGYFNTIFAKATSAQYADLAEMYVSGAHYEPGTVVIFGGSYEVEISTTSHANHVAGVVSTNPSYIMNATQSGPHVLPIALQGRVPTKVVGTVKKGDRMVTSHIPGVATVLDPARYEPGCIIGKALTTHEPSYDENGNEIVGTIEVVVGRV